MRKILGLIIILMGARTSDYYTTMQPFKASLTCSVHLVYIEIGVQ